MNTTQNGGSMEKQHKTMRLPVELVRKIEKRAKSENRSFSNMVEQILKKGV